MAQPLLDELLRRLDWPTPEADILDWDEVSQWPPDALATLRQSSVLLPVEPAKSVACDACSDGHFEEVHFVPSPNGAPERIYISCPACGPVEVEPERLQRFRLQIEGIVSLCGLARDATDSVRILCPGRLIDLGVQNFDTLRVRTFLGRGLCWGDASLLLDQVRSVAGDSETLVLVPSVALLPAGTNVRVLPLLGNLVFKAGAVRLSGPNLRTSAFPFCPRPTPCAG